MLGERRRGDRERRVGRGARGFAGLPAYVASKHGVVGLTRSRPRSSARAQGIRINCVCPGSARTPMLEGFMGGDPKIEKAMAAGARSAGWRRPRRSRQRSSGCAPTPRRSWSATRWRSTAAASSSSPARNGGLVSGETGHLVAGLVEHDGRMDLKLELVILPVSDVDRAKAFYVDQVGFIADHDQRVNDELRFVQLTPPGSACSIAIGEGLTDGGPGSVKGLQMVVDDVDAARAELVGARRRGQRGRAPRLGLVRLLRRPRRQQLGAAAAPGPRLISPGGSPRPGAGRGMIGAVPASPRNDDRPRPGQPLRCDDGRAAATDDPSSCRGRPIVVATDGSCLTNPGPGGWCWYADDDRWATGAEPATTNNRMELMAVLEALRVLPADRLLVIKADSSYTIDACTKWIHGWKRRGWKTAQRAPVKNRELIEAIDTALTGRAVTFEWVKGHAGHDLNEAADLRCRAAAEATKAGTVVAPGPGWGDRDRVTR